MSGERPLQRGLHLLTKGAARELLRELRFELGSDEREHVRVAGHEGSPQVGLPKQQGVVTSPELNRAPEIGLRTLRGAARTG